MVQHSFIYNVRQGVVTLRRVPYLPLSLGVFGVLVAVLLAIAIRGLRYPIGRNSSNRMGSVTGRIELRHALVSIGLLIALTGLALTGDFDAGWLPYHNASLGYSFFDVGLSGFIVFVFIDQVQNGSKRRIWKEVRRQTIVELQRELNGIAADVILVTGASGVAAISPNATEKEETEAMRKATLERMQMLAADTNQLRGSVIDGLLDRAFPDLFSMRATRLRTLELRNWQDFLDPKRIGLMIDLEQLLDSLETHLVILRKERKFESELARKSAELYEKTVYEDLQLLLKRILQGVKDGLITVLP